MPKLRDHEKLTNQWPPTIGTPQGTYDELHPGGEWGDLIRVKWVVPDRKGDLPYISAWVQWNDLDYRFVFSGEDTAFLKRLYDILRVHGVGKTLEKVGDLVLEF